MRDDGALIQIVDAALAEAARQCGPWLLCRPGCADCCQGEFAITHLDARRLRQGLAELESREPGRAAQVRRRAQAFQSQDACPALDPATQTCDLYAARPITCRTFGPPVRCGDDAVGVCQLCFQGATDTEIAACEVEIDPEGLEVRLLEELEQSTGLCGETTVADALSAPH